MSERRPAVTLAGVVDWLGWSPGPDFVTKALTQLDLTYEGIPGDVHAGLTRKSGAREPWYKRGTPMRNERQLSLVSTPELAEVAAGLTIPTLEAAWIGANLVLSGIDGFSRLPPRTLLLFPSGAAIRIDGDNGPCRSSGRAIARHVPDRPDIEFGFPKVARQKRGLVGWVEREGRVQLGDAVTVRVWAHGLYP